MWVRACAHTNEQQKQIVGSIEPHLNSHRAVVSSSMQNELEATRCLQMYTVTHYTCVLLERKTIDVCVRQQGTREASAADGWTCTRRRRGSTALQPNQVVAASQMRRIRNHEALDVVNVGQGRAAKTWPCCDRTLSPNAGRSNPARDETPRQNMQQTSWQTRSARAAPAHRHRLHRNRKTGAPVSWASPYNCSSSLGQVTPARKP